MLVLGSWNTLNIKMQQVSCAPTLDKHPTDTFQGACKPGEKLFRKPWTQNILMFIAEASLLIPYFIQRNHRRRSARDALVQPAAEPRPKVPFYTFAVPACCDVFGTGLGSVSMLFLDSAIWQMLRSSIIICSAVLSVTFLRKRLQPFMWVAVGVVFVGLVLVGLASVLDASGDTDKKANSPSAGQQLIGIALVISAQVCAAFQMVFEEMLLTSPHRAKTSAKKTVGCEGCWGFAFMGLGLLVMGFVPGDDDGHYESAVDGAYMIANNGVLLFFVLTYMASICLYNFCGITVGKKMSAVVRCLVDSCRTVVVWAVNLVLAALGSPYGSPWTPHSWLTAFGFMWLVFGTLLYNEVIPAPACLRRPSETREEDAADDNVSCVGGTSLILNKVDNADELEGEHPGPMEVEAARAPPRTSSGYSQEY
jgi:drug/metabolite transporter (DMT)-like permease